MTECAPEMPVKSALVPMGAESVRRCSSVPPMREGAHFGAGLKSPCQCGGPALLQPVLAPREDHALGAPATDVLTSSRSLVTCSMCGRGWVVHLECKRELQCRPCWRRSNCEEHAVGAPPCPPPPSPARAFASAIPAFAG